MDSATKKCKCPCHQMGAISLILIGLAFLLKNFNVIDDQMLNIAWPSILILAGVSKMCSGMCKCCNPGCCKKD